MKQPVDSTLPRVAIFIVKSESVIFVWSVAENDDIHLACRGDHNVFEENLQACHVVVRARYDYKMHIRLLPKSVIYVSLPQRGKGDRLRWMRCS